MLDAGPLIALFYEKDTYHKICVGGFSELFNSTTALLIPLPIVFEVYKWLLQRNRADIAKSALQTMDEKFSILSFDDETFDNLRTVITSLPTWKGSLEDATVMLLAVQHDCPVWTYNFRDFGTFEYLEFWNPTAQGSKEL